MIARLLQRLRQLFWDRAPRSHTDEALMRLGRYFVVLARDLLDGQLSMRVMGLVYTTLLSLVPLLALAFSVLKAFDVHTALLPVLQEVLRPLGPQGVQLALQVVGFVENIKVGVLGSLGVLLLFYTAVSMIQKIETSFNWIWRIERQRPLGARITEYLAILMAGPAAVFFALGITGAFLNTDAVAWLSTIEPFGFLLFFLSRLLPYVLIIGLFTFLYAFIPNTRVKFRPALAGGLLAGVLWQTASYAFASFVAGATQYNAIYTGFALVIFLLLWLYVSWLILLTGCQLSFYVQRPEHLTPHRIAPYLSGRNAEYLGLSVMALVGRRFLAGEPALGRDELARSLNAAPEHIDRVVDVLRFAGLLVEGGEGSTRLLPARDLGNITLAELWRRLRSGFDATDSWALRTDLARAVSALILHAERDFDDGPGAQSVRDWLLAPPAGSEGGAVGSGAARADLAPQPEPAAAPRPRRSAE